MTQLKGVSSNQTAAMLHPTVGPSAAPMSIAAELLLTTTSLGKALDLTQSIPVYAYVLSTEDGRQVTVLDTFPAYAVGHCLKLFESAGRRDYPRIVSGDGCKAPIPIEH